MIRAPRVFKTHALLKDAKRKSKLTRDEAKELEDELRYDINTQFGTRNEDEALRAYERQTGTEVSGCTPSGMFDADRHRAEEPTRAVSGGGGSPWAISSYKGQARGNQERLVGSARVLRTDRKLRA